MREELEKSAGRTQAEEIAEARDAQAAGNIGRARTCARRAVGMMLRDKVGIGPGAHEYAPTFIHGLRRLATDPALPAGVRAAAVRLADRAKPDRSSASENPVRDAEIIFHHFGAE